MTTVDSYEGSLALLERFAGHGFQIENLSPGMLDQAVLSIGTNSGSKAQATLNRHRSAWRSFSRWAFETGRISANPAILLRLPRTDSSPAVAITTAETRLLLSVIRDSGHPLRLRDEALFSIYALTGIRRAEALSLNSSDYDAVARTLRVRDAKSGRGRSVPVIEPLGGLRERFRENFRFRAGTGEDPFFRGQPAGRYLTVRQAQGRFEHWRSVARLRSELTIHSFRAGFATVLYWGTGDVALVSRALGHRDPRPILRYVELAAGYLERAIRNSFREYGNGYRGGMNRRKICGKIRGRWIPSLSITSTTSGMRFRR